MTDAGEGFAPKDVAPISSVRADFEGGERMGGWGLELIKGLTDKLDFTVADPHGTTVRAEKNLHYETKGDAQEAAERDTDSGGEVTATKK